MTTRSNVNALKMAKYLAFPGPLPVMMMSNRGNGTAATALLRSYNLAASKSTCFPVFSALCSQMTALQTVVFKGLSLALQKGREKAP
jgi:hypothetical protein